MRNKDELGSIRTIVLPITFHTQQNKEIFLDYQKRYNWMYHYDYNRMVDSIDNSGEIPSESQINLLVLQNMNHVERINSWLRGGCYRDAKLKAIKYKPRNNKVIFGGRKLYLDRCAGKISKQQYIEDKKLVPIYSPGEAIYAGKQGGNRIFQIVDETMIICKLSKQHMILVNLPELNKKIKQTILYLKYLQDNMLCPISYRLSDEKIYISVDNYYFRKDEDYVGIANRAFAVDLNPNYIGWSVVDWKDSDTYKLVDSGVVSFRKFTDIENKFKSASDSTERKDLQNKKTFEIADTVIQLINIAKHHHCALFGIEDLSIQLNGKEGYSKQYRKLVNNQWNITKITDLFYKYCVIQGIKFIKVNPAYSSFEGNLVYRQERLPDMCLSSIEIGRRAFEFYHQYIKKDKLKQKNIIFNESETAINKVIQSLEELNHPAKFSNLKGLYYKVKESDCNYRFPLEKSIFNTVFRKKSMKSRVLLYST